MDNNTYEGKTRYQKNYIADSYDKNRFTSFKGVLTDKLEKYWIRKALNIANVNGNILDLPCGTGRITEMLLEMGHKVTAGDISEKMMKYAKEKTNKYGDQVKYYVCDVEKLTFPNNSFELILTLRLIHHIPPTLHDKILRELHRTTNKWLLISFSNKYSLQNLRRNIVSIFNKFPRYSISTSQFKSEVINTGYKIRKVYHLFPIISETVIVLLEKQKTWPSSDSII